MGSIAGMVSGLISGGQKLPTLDMAALYDTISKAGTEQRALINALPPEIQKNLQDYAASMGAAGDKYQSDIEGQGKSYLDQIKGIYGPNSDAATAENVANKMQIYSTVPGSQNAIRAAMAQSGGLSRGNAGALIAQPYDTAAAQYGQASANVNARQTQQAQQATQQALQTINSMDEAMFTNLFGMNKQQAQTILTTGNDALKEQLSGLINESTQRENATLGIQGAAAQNAYQNAAIRNAQQLAVWNGLASPLTGWADASIEGANRDTSQGASGWLGSIFGGGGGSGMPAGTDVGSQGYMRNAAAMGAAALAA